MTRFDAYGVEVSKGEPTMSRLEYNTSHRRELRWLVWKGLDGRNYTGSGSFSTLAEAEAMSQMLNDQGYYTRITDRKIRPNSSGFLARSVNGMNYYESDAEGNLEIRKLT